MNRLLFVGFVFVAAAWPQEFDLLLQGGRVMDPKSRLDAGRDVAIKGGKIAAIEPSIAAGRAKKVLDVKGLLITPGLIDLHVHAYFTASNPGSWAGDNSLPPDAFSFRTGVTTMVDAGSSGWRNFEHFKVTVIDRAKTRVLAMINIAGFGMISDLTEQGDFDPAAVAKLKAKYPETVDFGYFLPQRPYYQLVAEHLRPGDISTHAYRGPVPWVDEQGKIYPYLLAARKRGVKFDVGHGGGSFVLRSAAGAMANGFYPDTISSDLHTGSMNGAFMDMPTLMSKMMALGMPLNEVIRASTWTPAELIQRPDLGNLTVGAVADLTGLRLMEGEFGYYDNSGGRVASKQRLFCELTLKDGAISWDFNGRQGMDYKRLGPRYGIREGIDQILVPKQ